MDQLWPHRGRLVWINPVHQARAAALNASLCQQRPHRQLSTGPGSTLVHNSQRAEPQAGESVVFSLQGRRGGAERGTEGGSFGPLAPPRSRTRRSVALAELLAWYKNQADAPGEAPQAEAGGGAEGGEESPSAAPGDQDEECSICLELLSSSPTVRAGGGCSHALHASCCANLITHGSRTCPVCRTTLIPPELAHLQADLVSSSRARLAGPPGLIPGVEPRAGGVITADDWEFSEDEDVEQGERGLRRLSLQAREELLAQLRSDTRQMAHVRSVCARVSIGVFGSLIALVLFLLIGSFSRDP